MMRWLGGGVLALAVLAVVTDATAQDVPKCRCEVRSTERLAELEVRRNAWAQLFNRFEGREAGKSAEWEAYRGASSDRASYADYMGGVLSRATALYAMEAACDFDMTVSAGHTAENAMKLARRYEDYQRASVYFYRPPLALRSPDVLAGPAGRELAATYRQRVLQFALQLVNGAGAFRKPDAFVGSVGQYGPDLDNAADKARFARVLIRVNGGDPAPDIPHGDDVEFSDFLYLPFKAAGTPETLTVTSLRGRRLVPGGPLRIHWEAVGSEVPVASGLWAAREEHNHLLFWRSELLEMTGLVQFLGEYAEEKRENWACDIIKFMHQKATDADRQHTFKCDHPG